MDVKCYVCYIPLVNVHYNGFTQVVYMLIVIFSLKDNYVKVINVFANDFMLNLQSYELNKKFSVLSHYCVVEMSWLTKMKITMVLNFFLWIMKIKLVFLPFPTI